MSEQMHGMRGSLQKMLLALLIFSWRSSLRLKHAYCEYQALSTREHLFLALGMSGVSVGESILQKLALPRTDGNLVNK